MKRPFGWFGRSAAARISAACQCVLALSYAASISAGSAEFRAGKLQQIDDAVQQAIQEHACPGGVLWLEHQGAVYHKAYGNRALVPKPEPMTEDTIFDMASLTKVV